MMVYVANPLYDAVFKYLMEDDRIAKTILSALLQKEVVEVENLTKNGMDDATVMKMTGLTEEQIRKFK